ncbi:PREDICTED: tumor necrosis factor receptor superfamily member 13B [Cyprinodon variegatus]|uniref:TNF receptor superfamily member 13B n=1 Tax=Cyprinodon variegatus TaxID=28743 RepID=A0A3Q2GK07_CYPVA|nr:PREDICTED: tumor necrosis factor receptor superfamily member 13B [Cyprinodon variegatus]
MVRRCKEDEHLDGLTRSCQPCRLQCQKPLGVSKCDVYCKAALCTAKPGHYYDRLVRRCIKCAEICGKHPAECNPHCPTPSLPVTTKGLHFNVNEHGVSNSRPVGLLQHTTLLYSLLAVCTVLILSSLCLALVVFLRRGKAKKENSNHMSTRDQIQEYAVQPGQESAFPGRQAGRSPNDFQPSSNHLIYREPSEDSYPTETCVCVHCFPDLRGLGQDNNGLQKAPHSYHQGILHKAHIQNRGSLWPKGSQCNSALQKAAVG